MESGGAHIFCNIDGVFDIRTSSTHPHSFPHLCSGYGPFECFLALSRAYSYPPINRHEISSYKPNMSEIRAFLC